MAEQRPFKPFVEGSIPSALTEILPAEGFLFITYPIRLKSLRAERSEPIGERSRNAVIFKTTDPSTTGLQRARSPSAQGEEILSISSLSSPNMRAIIIFTHVIRTSSRSYGIFPARRLLEHQEAGQTRQGTGYARCGDHRPRHDVRGDRLLQSGDRSRASNRSSAWKPTWRRAA